MVSTGRARLGGCDIARFQDVMPASAAFAIDCVSGPIRIGSDPAPETPGVHPLARALGPALLTAYGLEHAVLFPDEIQALVAALRAGPLGNATVPRETRPVERCLEPA